MRLRDSSPDLVLIMDDAGDVVVVGGVVDVLEVHEV
jgi:hypothetical protein